ncbi:MAG: methylated-DNA--[protein]-cysteine S-methyltransferase [Gammaproteobacteria bacterium]
MDDIQHPRIARAIRWLVAHFDAQPSLDEAAAVACMSPAHFSREFHRFAGVSPKLFVKHLTLDHLKARLAAGDDLWSATTSAGLSGLGRVHDHFVTLDAVTPGEYRRGGEGLKIEYGFHDCPFGEVLLAATPRGICFLAFVDADARARALSELQQTSPGAALAENPGATAAQAAQLGVPGVAPVTLCVPGTNFQVQVWRALLRIPEGAITTYAALAAAVGRPTATRAVANAVGANPVSWLIPCHRVIRTSGALGGYRWGLDAKRALLAYEEARRGGTLLKSAS